MPRAYRRHQGLVRLIIIISFFYTRYSKSLFVFSYHRLEERGWMVFPQHEGGNGECSGDHDGSTIVLVQTRKRRMDPERYLDATQRCVFDRGIMDAFFLSDSRVFFCVVKGSHEGLAGVDFWRSSESESNDTCMCFDIVVLVVGSSRRTPGSF
jgi:hypothetical protein